MAVKYEWYFGALTMKSWLFISIAYMLSLIIAAFAIQLHVVEGLALQTLFADVVATVVIFCFSTLFKNASFYDPYWSVLPIFITFFWIMEIKDLSERSATDMWRSLLLLLVIVLWGIRLTLNWARRWKGLSDEDWRYSDLRNKTGKFFPFVNFFGIHLFPTLIVFLALIPCLGAITSLASLNLIDWIAFLVCITAVAIEYIADEQLKSFLKGRKSAEEILETGLWKYSRHPNYFGEVLFWWGIYLFALAAGFANWWTIFGAIAMTLLFVFISIPLMDKRMLERKPGYDRRMKNISAFIPWFTK